MSYTRKRTLLACDFCRRRKRKCDSARPKCSNCASRDALYDPGLRHTTSCQRLTRRATVESNADCVYQELVTERIEPTSPGAVAERLSRIEALLEEQSQRLGELSLGQRPSVSFSQPHFTLPAPHLAPSLALGEQSQPSVEEQAQFLIPVDHLTSANSLLSLPVVSNLTGRYPRDLFFDIEERQPLPDGLHFMSSAHVEWPSLDRSLTAKLAENYFRVVHPHFPLFPVQAFNDLQSDLFVNGPSETVGTAMCLCVYALGSISSPEGEGVDPAVQQQRDEMSLRFFDPALRIILARSMWGFRPNLEICQALLLAASYFAYLGRPLHSWKMAHHAAHKFIFLSEQRQKMGLVHEQDDNHLRVFWTCFMIECDRAAELYIPRSGVEPLADKMFLTRSLDPSEHDDILYFVAETAIRRLMNRIYSSLFSADSSEMVALADELPLPPTFGLNKLLALSSELNRQLEEWYSSIPLRIRPAMGIEEEENDRGHILRLRYYAAKAIIHRPFVLYAAHQRAAVDTTSSLGDSSAQPGNVLPNVILEKCEASVGSCRMYLFNVVGVLEKRTPYLWTLSQSAMASLLVFVLASSCPELKPLASDFEQLRAMVLPGLKRWATEGSSFEAVVKIVEGLGVH